ncbi:MAG: glycosyltransferase [Leptolyngbyaceae cyanobacterium MO_188.B28]|nr:glycosyltransferase [Leptolyngbyaceae cyanobacterium MO_188.B28]
MKTVALIETNHGNGHHLTYLRLFSKTLLELGHQVMAFYPEPDELTTWIQTHVPEGAEKLWAFKLNKSKRRKIPLIGSAPQPVAVVDRWRHVASAVRSASQKIGVSPDLVFFNWLDNYLSHYLPHQVIDYVFPYNWSGLYFRPGVLRFGERSVGGFGELAHYAAAKSSRCQALAMLNEELVEGLQETLGKPVIAFPDITDETPPDAKFFLTKEIREKAGSRKVIGLIGTLSKRKGILTLLETAHQSTQENWFFVFAGPLVENLFNQDFDQRLTEDYLRVKQLIESPPPNCFFHLESIPDDGKFNAAIDACDVIFAAYENFPYSSNLLTKAAVLKKPIVVSKGYCMAERVKKFRFGVAIPEGDVSQCIQALHYLCNQPEKVETELNPDFEGYQSLHSQQQIRHVFESILSHLDTQLMAA